MLFSDLTHKASTLDVFNSQGVAAGSRQEEDLLLGCKFRLCVCSSHISSSSGYKGE